MDQPLHTLDSVDDGIAAIRNGELVVVVDDTDRENEGDLIMAASKATLPGLFATWSRPVGSVSSSVDVLGATAEVPAGEAVAWSASALAAAIR